MKAVFFESHGSTAVLNHGDFPDPSPGPDECLVRVRAVALNGFEPMILQGSTSLKTPLPMIPGGDIAGDIVEVSADAAARWRPGMRVLVEPATSSGVFGETRRGGCAEYVAVPVANLRALPDGVRHVLYPLRAAARARA